MSALDRVTIANSYFIDGLVQKDIEQAYSVKASTLGSLLRNVRKNPQYLQGLKEKEEQEQERFSTLEAVTQKMIKDNKPIFKVADMVKVVNKKVEKPFKDHEVNRLFVKDLNLRYKRTRKQTLNTNASRCLVQRQ